MCLVCYDLGNTLVLATHDACPIITLANQHVLIIQLHFFKLREYLRAFSLCRKVRYWDESHKTFVNGPTEKVAKHNSQLFSLPAIFTFMRQNCKLTSFSNLICYFIQNCLCHDGQNFILNVMTNIFGIVWLTVSLYCPISFIRSIKLPAFTLL